MEQHEPLDPFKAFMVDYHALRVIRNLGHERAEQLVGKYDLRLPGDPRAELGDDFVEEVLRTMRRRIEDHQFGKEFKDK